MDKSELERLLDRNAHSLASGSWTPAAWAELTPRERDELLAVAQLRQWLGEMLVVISPRPAFRTDLQRQLLASHGEHLGWPRALWGQLRRHRMLTAAAAASGVSLAVGAISVAVLYRARSDI